MKHFTLFHSSLAFSKWLFVLLGVSCFCACQSKTAPVYQLVQVDDYASCFVYEIHTQEGKSVALPPPVAKVLDCPGMIDLHQQTLVYWEDREVKQYRINTKTAETLFSVNENMDGISKPAWSAKGDALAFVIIHQAMGQGFKYPTRLIVLTLQKDGAVAQKQEYDVPVGFTCGSICFSTPGEQFYFSDDKTINYQTPQKQTLSVKLP